MNVLVLTGSDLEAQAEVTEIILHRIARAGVKLFVAHCDGTSEAVAYVAHGCTVDCWQIGGNALPATDDLHIVHITDAQLIDPAKPVEEALQAFFLRLASVSPRIAVCGISAPKQPFPAAMAASHTTQEIFP